MEAAGVCSGGSTVLVAVVMVVKYRACLLVGRLIVGVLVQLVVYSGRRHIGMRACMGAGAVYTGIKEWLLFFF